MVVKILPIYFLVVQLQYIPTNIVLPKTGIFRHEYAKIWKYPIVDTSSMTPWLHPNHHNRYQTIITHNSASAELGAAYGDSFCDEEQEQQELGILGVWCGFQNP